MFQTSISRKASTIGLSARHTFLLTQHQTEHDARRKVAIGINRHIGQALTPGMK